MSKISAPRPNKPLTDKEMQSYVQAVLKPIADDFMKNHKGKEFTEDDVETLYSNLASALEKDPRSTFKKDLELDYAIIETTTKEINKKDSELSYSDKAIQYFGKLCKKIGAKEWGEACLKHVEDNSLKKSLDKIATNISAARESASFNYSESWQKADKGIIKEARKGGKKLEEVQKKLDKNLRKSVSGSKSKSDEMLSKRAKDAQKARQEKFGGNRAR